MKNMKRKRTPIYLPHEIIENILSRLPVNSLLRFKAVCKQWKIAISDPKFNQIHLQQFNNSICPRLLAHRSLAEERAMELVEIKNGEFREFSAVDYPLENLSETTVLCHCDGLFLLSCYSPGDPNEYILWNPSRRNHKNLCYPYPFESGLNFGICYDSLVKDYKVVIGDTKHYAVFSCRNNSWSEIKQMSALSCKIPFHHRLSSCSGGASSNGSIYWVWFSIIREDSVNLRPFEIVCFDGSDEKFKNLPKLDGRVGYGDLISSGDVLYLFPYYGSSNYGSGNFILTNELLFMKRVGDEEAWMELKVQLPVSCSSAWPVCFTHRNAIIVMVCCDGMYLFYLYDESKKTSSQIQNSSHYGFTHNLFPYVENLFLL